MLYTLVCNTLLWALILLLKNMKYRTPGYFMAFVQISFFLTFVSIIPYYFGNIELMIKLEPLYILGILSIFPYIYIYIRLITTKQRVDTKRLILYLLPAFILSGQSIFVSLSLSSEEQILYTSDIWQSQSASSALYFFQHMKILVKIVVLCQSLYYLYMMTRLVIRYKKSALDYFSNYEKKYLNWIHYFYIIFFLSLIASYPPIILGNSYMVQDNNMLVICFLILNVVFFWIAFMADNHTYIDDDNFYTDSIRKMEKEDHLSNDKLIKLAHKLEHYFRTEKPYLNQDLRITHVAQDMMTNRTYVSDAIREVHKTNFSYYVNSYRVKEAVVLFDDEGHFEDRTSAISSRVGFNSYNRFIKYFKAIHGCTPSEYRSRQAKMN